MTPPATLRDLADGSDYQVGLALNVLASLRQQVKDAEEQVRELQERAAAYRRAADLLAAEPPPAGGERTMGGPHVPTGDGRRKPRSPRP